MPATPHADATALADLLRAVGAGDSQAFATLYDAVSPLVHGISLRVLRDPDLAAETTQDVLLEVWRTADRYDSERGSPRSWLATMAHRRAVDRVRAVQSERTRDVADAARNQLPALDHVAEEVEQRDEAGRVGDCLGVLTPPQREAVRLAYWGALTYREVSERLGTPLPTVKSRIRDGLARLRDCLTGTRGPAGETGREGARP